MSAATLSGFALVLAAGIMNGSFAVPMKWTRNWAWENTWIAWSFIALIIFPFALTTATIPGVAGLYRSSDPSILFWVCAAGAAWGASQVLFGLGIKRAGMALGFAIVVGLAAATGSLIPLLQLQPNQSGVSTWHGVVLGIAIIIVGISLCSYAGGIKDKSADSSAKESSTGILLCIAAGLGGSMINIGMVAGAPLAARAAAVGVPPLHQTNAVWLPLLFAGFVSTAVYCAWLLTANGNWRLFIAPGALSYWLLAAVMAACWFGSVELYGIAASRLGEWGPVLGWPIFLSSSILTANAWGLATGEWRQAALRPRWFMLAGVCCLVAAIFVIGLAGMRRASS